MGWRCLDPLHSMPPFLLWLDVPWSIGMLLSQRPKESFLLLAYPRTDLWKLTEANAKYPASGDKAAQTSKQKPLLVREKGLHVRRLNS